MRSRLLAASAAVLPLLACRAEYRPAGPIVAHAHPSGLVLRLPARLDDGRAVRDVAVERTADGFRIRLSGWDRWPTSVTVAQRPASAAPHEEPRARDEPRAREVHRRTVHSTVERDAEGGSCGGQQTLRAWESCGDRVLVYQQEISDGCGDEGRFGLAWKVIEGTECPRLGDR